MAVPCRPSWVIMAPLILNLLRPWSIPGRVLKHKTLISYIRLPAFPSVKLSVRWQTFEHWIFGINKYDIVIFGKYLQIYWKVIYNDVYREIRECVEAERGSRRPGSVAEVALVEQKMRILMGVILWWSFMEVLSLLTLDPQWNDLETKYLLSLWRESWSLWSERQRSINCAVISSWEFLTILMAEKWSDMHGSL